MSYKSGDVVGRVTLISTREGTNTPGRIVWNTRCSCGELKPLRQDYLDYCVKTERIANCGCIQREIDADARTEVYYREANNPTWRIWSAMVSRCTDPSDPDYAKCGALGIEVHDLWAVNFAQFLRDMGERPRGYKFDREDPKGDYTPANCKWVPMLTGHEPVPGVHRTRIAALLQSKR